MPSIASRPGDWVRESRFGVWFLNTHIWADHVLKLALDDLERLMAPKRARYPVILDVGCGHGHSLRQLDERFGPDTIFALDVDPRARRWSAPHAEQCSSRVAFLTDDAARIPLADQSVDLVFCHQTFHHLIDQEAAAAEFYRVLRPGGVLLFAESCRRYIHSWLIRFLFRHPMDVQRTDGEYIKLLQAAGFTIAADAISRPFLWWSRPDLGLLEALGRRPPADREETLVYLCASRADRADAAST